MTVLYELIEGQKCAGSQDWRREKMSCMLTSVDAMTFQEDAASNSKLAVDQASAKASTKVYTAEDRL